MPSIPPTSPAYYLIEALAEADRYITVHLRDQPLLCASDADVRLWSEQHDNLLALRNKAFAINRSRLCRRCGGHGEHGRPGGFPVTCVLCSGDGWSVTGRREWWALVALDPTPGRVA